MKIAIIGGGFFGIASAIKVKERFPKAQVTIYEMRDDLLKGTSGKNQSRWHKGYHYPRSEKTIAECKNSYNEFNRYFSKSRIVSQNYYAISKNDSLTNFKDYLKILEKNNLAYKVVDNNILNKRLVEGVVKVDENLISISKARSISHKLLKHLNIKIFLKKKIMLDNNFKKKFNFIILSTYENNNNLLKSKKKFKFQLVEKIIVKTPNFLKKKSFVIMDGKFMCIDPYENNKFSIIGNVKKTIHAENINYKPKFNKVYDKLLFNYHNTEKTFSKFKEINEDYKFFFDRTKDLKYVSSFFVIRCTRPFKEKTDERLTHINIQENIISLFSGKWVSCFEVANKVLKIIK